MARPHRRTAKLFAPEVVQTSAMDCGPAALKCLLEGFRLHASYGRLREACQTNVDGTSIDALEDLANNVGLIAEQILLPIDHVRCSAADVLPAIVVVRQPGGTLHFVVAWRRHGPVMQVMDPATGRRWPSTQMFANEIYSHTILVPAAAWRTWVDSDLFDQGVRARARECGVRDTAIDSVLRAATDDKSWHSMAAMDASLRMVSSLRNSGAFGRGDAERTLRVIWERTHAAADPTAIVPADYWTVRPGEPIEGTEHVRVRGAVLVRVRGVRAVAEQAGRARALPREVAAALSEPPADPGWHLLRLVRADGILAPAALLTALGIATLGVVVEALLFRSLIELGPHLSLSGQRLAAIGFIVGLSGLLLALEFPITGAALGFGRRLEMRLRIAFMRKIPRLADRYLQSRPSSDMAERAHSVHQIRELPNMAVQLVRCVFELILTTAGIAVLYPETATIAVIAAAVALAIPVVAQPSLRERDLRQRTHTGALTRFFLDAFLGLVPVRAHGAECALAREQESLLVEWTHAARALVRTVMTTSAVQLVAGMSFAAALLFARSRGGDEAGGALLLAYWSLNIPLLGQEIAQISWQYPTQRNLVLRLLEPLGALEAEQPAADSQPRTREGSTSPGVRIDLRDVAVRAAGHTILEEVTLTIPPGAHVAIVGASGAGKSTLVGLLLGWHVPATGVVEVDGTSLDGAWLDEVRRQTAWVDPAVQLWNRSLIENLEFGSAGNSSVPVGVRISEADLLKLIEQLPDGLQTPLGEGGALISGGEGQRVRFGRSLGRSRARLVLFDEPFRGLERDRRAGLLRRARERWRDSTVLCVTHDISETSSFDRVLVVADGRLVEDGTPVELANRTDSQYRSLLDREASMHLRLWADPLWRTLRVAAGRIVGGALSSEAARDTGRTGEDETLRPVQANV